MSKNETPMTRWYWQQVGGTLIEEFIMTRRTPTSSIRRADGLIILDGPTKLSEGVNLDVTNRHVVVVQTKAAILGMNLIGQTLFSKLLVERNFQAASVKAVALCQREDDVLKELLASFDGVEVVVTPSILPSLG